MNNLGHSKDCSMSGHKDVACGLGQELWQDGLTHVLRVEGSQVMEGLKGMKFKEFKCVKYAGAKDHNNDYNNDMDNKSNDDDGTEDDNGDKVIIQCS